MHPDRSRLAALLLALGSALTLLVALSWFVPVARAAPDVEYIYICAADGVGAVSTLRTYIIGANANPGPDEIVVVPAQSSTADACTFTATTAEDDYGNGGVGLPLITGTLVIRGEGIRVVLRRQGTESFRLLESAADLTLENVTVRNGRAAPSHNGGGVLAHQSLTLTNVLLTGNVGYSGGGAYAFGDLTVTAAAFYTNTAVANGGGLLASAALSVSAGTFAHNQADYGGGLYVESEGTDVQVSGASFEHNVAATSGAGLHVLRQINVESAAFSGNEAVAGGGGAFIAGGIVSDTLFADNTASGSGVDYGGGGLMVLQDATVRRCHFIANTAPDGGGLFLAHTPPGDVSLLVNNLWLDNEATDGAAIFAGFTADADPTGGHAEMRHNTVVRPAPAGGSAVHVVEGSASVYNSIITGHTVGVAAGPQATVISDYNLFFANEVRHAGVMVTAGADNLDGDPLFVNAAGGDYRLLWNSPAVDSGDDLGTGVDLDGVLRPQRDGFDRGAYEYVNTPPTAAPNAYSTTLDRALTVAAPGVLDNDGDVDGDDLTAALANGPGHGNLTLNPDGSFTYTPAPGFSGSDAFTYRADDGQDTSAPATVTLVVEPVYTTYLPAALRP